MKEQIEKAIKFYEYSPDGQYDDIAVIALKHYLESLSVEPKAESVEAMQDTSEQWKIFIEGRIMSGIFGENLQISKATQNALNGFIVIKEENLDLYTLPSVKPEQTDKVNEL